MSVFDQIAAVLRDAHTHDGGIKTAALLSACQALLPVIDKLGTGLALVKSDINGNITRLTAAQSRDPDRYQALYPIILDEVAHAQPTASSSDTNGLLWLKRAMEFLVALLLRLCTDPSTSLSTAASEVYTATLYRYHTWYTSAAFTVALKFVPSREGFLEHVATPECQGDELLSAIRRFVDAFTPVLAEVQGFLASHNLDFQTRV